ncbi:MAG: hypothetical protein DMG29_13975 [Acidobacteria bacterium]|nr:MAG: hypothetical protein DMG29_13975 [Acidobacteriota bacterium]
MSHRRRRPQCSPRARVPCAAWRVAHFCPRPEAKVPSFSEAYFFLSRSPGAPINCGELMCAVW